MSNLPIEGFNIFVNSPLYVFVWLFFLEIKQPLPLLLVKRRRFAPGAPLEHAFAIDKAPKMESPQNCVTAKQFNSALVALLNGGHCMGSRKLEWAAYCEAGRPGSSHSRVFLTYKAVVFKTLIVGDSDGDGAQRLVTGDVGTFQEDIVNPIAASAAALGTKQDRKVINDFPIAGDRLIASDGDDPGIDGSCIIGADRELH